VSEPYDSAPDTIAHIRRVRDLLLVVAGDLRQRGRDHDESKLYPPEKPLFDEWTPKLRSLTYGSPEYEAARQAMGEALQHHYAHNSHHPEHYPNGLSDMSLLDLIEMLADWKAATERHADGDLAKSLEHNRTRFGMSEQLHQILVNTARALEWLP
jgi:hypothetical protein